MLEITPSQLAAIMPLATPSLIETYCDPLNRMMSASSIDTPLRIAHFLAQVGEETGDMHAVVENLNYSAAGLMAIWPHLYTAEQAAAYAHKPEQIANRSYASRLGNGPEASGDGWKFRGRGFIQTTGHDNYLAYGKARNCVALIIANPDIILTDHDRTVDTACLYWQTRGCNAVADADDILKITRMVNGGLTNLKARQDHLARAKKALGITV